MVSRFHPRTVFWVDHPPLSFPQFLRLYGFFPVCVCCLVGVEYPVNFMKQVPENLVPILGSSLDDGNEVVLVHIYIGCGCLAMLLR